MQDKPFIAFGEAVWDIFPDKKRLGGAPLNFSHYFQKQGGNPKIVSAVGEDELGKKALSQIRDLGLDTKYIQINNSPTGTVNVIISKDSKDHEFAITRNVACEYINYPKNSELVEKAIGLYFGTVTRFSEKNRKIIDRLMVELKDKVILLDLNLRQDLYDKEDIRFLLKKVNYLKLNDEEARALEKMGLVKGTNSEEILKFLIQTYNLKACCVTLGSQGAIGGDQNQIVRVKGIPTQGEGDSVGAGDAFAATWLACLLKGKTIEESVRKANEIGSKVASKKGAIIDI